MTEEGQNQNQPELRSELSDLEVYVDVFESFVSDPVCIVNPNQIITDTNQAFLDRLQTTQSDIAGKPLGQLFQEADVGDELFSDPGLSQNQDATGRFTLKAGLQPEVVKVVTRKWEDARGNHRGFFVRLQETQKQDNSPRTSQVAPENVPRPDFSGQNQKPQDITNSEELLEEVKEQQMRAQSIFYNIDDGLLILDENDLIDMVNPSAASMLGMEPSDMIGHRFSELQDNPAVTKLYKLISANDELARHDLEIDEDHYLTVTTVGIGDEKGSARRVVILHDVSEKRRIEKIKLEFASVAAHQMRTPLSSIRWSFEILTKRLENESLLRAAKRGYKSSQQILEVIDELLNLDELEQGKSAYTFETLDIVNVLEEVVQQEKESYAAMDQAGVTFEKPGQHIPKVRGDASKLKIVFSNLIENALKYTITDDMVTVRVNIKVSSGYAGDMVQVVVEDSGIGIPEEDADQIFSKFYRAKNATKADTEGTGVGLFISKKIVEAHNGTIRFDSKVGEGTTFYVELPIVDRN